MGEVGKRASGPSLRFRAPGSGHLRKPRPERGEALRGGILVVGAIHPQGGIAKGRVHKGTVMRRLCIRNVDATVDVPFLRRCWHGP